MDCQKEMEFGEEVEFHDLRGSTSEPPACRKPWLTPTTSWLDPPSFGVAANNNPSSSPASALLRLQHSADLRHHNMPRSSHLQHTLLGLAPTAWGGVYMGSGQYHPWNQGEQGSKQVARTVLRVFKYVKHRTGGWKPCSIQPSPLITLMVTRCPQP
jgi:hypothetical protein